jgi:hypothetical protein
MGYSKTKDVSKNFVDAVFVLLRTYNKRLAMKIISLLLYKLQEKKSEFE